MWPGSRPTYVPSGILIHPTVWPQYNNVTVRQDRTDRIDNGPTGYGERFYKRSPKNQFTDKIAPAAAAAAAASSADQRERFANWQHRQPRFGHLARAMLSISSLNVMG